MILRNQLISKKYLFFIFLVCLSIFSSKWILSYVFFSDDLSLKIIFDTPSDGYFYYAHLKALSLFDFNNSFDISVHDLKNISLPFATLLFPSILYSLIGFYSLIILELVFTYFYILIFFLLMRQVEFKEINALCCSLLIIALPSILALMNLENVVYINVISQFFDLRFPRPFLINIVFYFFIFYLFKLNNKEIFTYRNFIIVSLILSYSLASFYYFFFIQALALIIYIIHQNKFKNFFYAKNLKYLFVFSIFFLFFLLPFIYFLVTSEPDYNERFNLLDLNFERKKILIFYLLQKLSSFKFLIIFFLITTLTVFSNYKKIKFFDYINILYYLFISSIVAPFLFIIISNKTGIVYHFINLIVLTTFIYIFFFLFISIKNFLNINFSINNYLTFFLILNFIFLYNLNVYKDFKNRINNEDYVSYREGISNSIKLINKVGVDNVNLLTFDSRLMVWAIMNDVKNIKPISGILVPKTNEMIENDLIESFKFLNMDDDMFITFFENKNRSWRVLNKNTQLFFWGKYSASSLKTFNDSRKFDQKILEIIDNTTPLNVQSIAIPNDELNRLQKKFIDYKKDKIENVLINITVLDYRNKLFMMSNIFKSKECENISTKYIKIFVSEGSLNKCKKIF